MLNIVPIPAFDDNYIWLLHNGRDAVVIDPGDSVPIIRFITKQKLNLCSILVTHHHLDHVGGVAALIGRYSPRIFAPKYEQFAFAHTPLSENDAISLPELGLTFKVMWLPGHTLGHIAYANDDYLFCGDVLFGAGCGRLFEGTPAQMLASLNRLKLLNANTQVFCTHEYTAKNIAFALTLEPKNQDLIERKIAVDALRSKNQPSLPTNIELELKTNPYLRCSQAAIIQNSQSPLHDELSVFTTIRTLRNHY